MPEHPEDEDPQRFHIPLDDLTGKHGYALARGEDDDAPIDPGAPVAYVADVVREQPNTMTVEGAIVGIGNLASSVAKEGGSPEWVMKGLLALFVLPIVVIVVGRLTEWI